MADWPNPKAFLLPNCSSTNPFEAACSRLLFEWVSTRLHWTGFHSDTNSAALCCHFRCSTRTKFIPLPPLLLVLSLWVSTMLASVCMYTMSWSPGRLEPPALSATQTHFKEMWPLTTASACRVKQQMYQRNKKLGNPQKRSTLFEFIYSKRLCEAKCIQV